ncbi:MAG: hypothetical protein VKJ02_01675 [Snowella sp.]|nr:hypothetical protein [Snowella sp.]
MLATESKPAVLTKKDFDPPLKREQAAVPGYWTLEEIAVEIGMTSRKVQYDVLGRPKIGLKPFLKAYKVAKVLLVPDDAALEYISRMRKKS